MTLCRYPPCKCLVAGAEIFSGDICAMLGAKLVNQSPGVGQRFR
jgi:hypothetical protein